MPLGWRSEFKSRHKRKSFDGVLRWSKMHELPEDARLKMVPGNTHMTTFHDSIEHSIHCENKEIGGSAIVQSSLQMPTYSRVYKHGSLQP